jgi:hypothetical protein
MTLTDWVNQVELLRQKVEGNPFGKISAGVILPKDCGLTQDILQVTLGDATIFQLNDQDINNAVIKSLFKDNKKRFEELLNTLTAKASELEVSTDKMLSVMVADQIPKAILARMEGASDGYSYQELMRKSTEEDTKNSWNKFKRALNNNPIRSIELTKTVKVTFDGKTSDWQVSLNLDSKTHRVDIGPFYCNRGDFWGHTGIVKSGWLRWKF